jgi:hypothetical protein
VSNTLNTKVVDLAILYDFQKGYIGFFAIDLAGGLANLECHSIAMNRRYGPLSKFFTFLH